jgi:hypothetical protein
MHDARDRNAGIWIQASDRLYVAAYSSVASLAVQVSGYFRRANGDVSEYAVTITPTSDRAVTASDVHFGEGFLLSCVASLVSGNASRGQCYVRAQVQRGTGTAAVKLHTVIAGYVSDEYGPSFPYGTQEGPLEGIGVVRNFAGANPAAGVATSDTVPAGVRWRLISVTVTLVTDATVDDRYVKITITNGTDTLYWITASPNTTAGNTQIFTFAHFGSRDTQNTSAYTGNIPLNLVLLPGWVVSFSHNNFNAGDNYGAPQFVVEEWIEA